MSNTVPPAQPRVGVGAIVLSPDGCRILLQLRNKPPEKDHWSIPGGRVEHMERVEDAIVRELKEELGIDVEIDRLLCVTNQIIPSEGVHWVAPAFLVRVLAGTPENLEPHATRRIEWFDLNKLPENLTVTTSSALRAYQRGRSHGVLARPTEG